MITRYIGVSLLFCLAGYGSAAESSRQEPARFLGPPACSSTSCHGGAGEKSNQNLIWSKFDYHSRSYATLTSARSERFAEVLKLGDATQSQRCTVCHAPSQTVPEQNRLATLKTSQGVSCESCHAPAENWLRSHTRPDFSHSDRVAAGMRDLKNLYVRANTCVACHQTLEPDLAAAGHPELIFELDGQSVTQPKHWRDPEEIGPKAWLVGQAVALREMSWQLARETKRDENLVARWQALVWLVQQVSTNDPAFPQLESVYVKPGQSEFESVQKTADAIAQHTATVDWTAQMTRKSLSKLAGAAQQFKDGNVSAKFHARRAERLVLGLDRLAIRLNDSSSKERDGAVSRLYKMVQSLPDFDPETFANELSRFPAAL